jgi:DNA-binding NtrC family response regulator
MAETVLLTTHDLPLAGELRQAFEAEDFVVDLVPSPAHGESRAGDAVLLVLTGIPADADEADAWVELAEGVLHVPRFVALPGPGGGGVPAGLEAQAREAGVVEFFAPGVPPDEVALVGRRTVERRRLQDATGIVGESDAIRELLERVVQIAPVDSTVLVTGESGTGKELVARGIHALSPRKHRAFLAVNVAALSDTLLESELFGHEKGAFTGAIDTRKGFFELANRGTLFLDEIGEMPLATQTKLLRVLEQREFMRVGGESSISVDVRVVAATNRELREAVARGDFRRDLYYRLNILDLRLPPLRERRGDISLLIRHFVRQVSERTDRPFPGLTPEAMQMLEAHDWPGNVRELRNLVESMVVLSPGRTIRPDDLPLEIRRPGSFLPVRWEGERGPRSGSHLPAPVAPPPAEASGGTLRPELEFVFRTLVDLRVDMEELRREFEAYRSQVDEGGRGAPAATLGSRVPRHDDVAAEYDDAGRPAGTPAGAGFPEVRAGGFRETAGDAPGDHPPGHDPPPDGRDSAQEAESGAPPLLEVRSGMTMDEIEEAAIRAVLQETEGNRRIAAERLGIGERTLYRKLKRYHIEL